MYIPLTLIISSNSCFAPPFVLAYMNVPNIWLSFSNIKLTNSLSSLLLLILKFMNVLVLCFYEFKKNCTLRNFEVIVSHMCINVSTRCVLQHNTSTHYDRIILCAENNGLINQPMRLNGLKRL